MKRSLALCAVLLFGLPHPAGAQARRFRTDWDTWYDGAVRVDLRIAGGEGTVVRPGHPARLSVEVNQDSYLMVYAIDPEGYVRLLFPRFWEDEGWVREDERVCLYDRPLSYPIEACNADGPLYVQAIASPRPFDWAGLGLVVCGDRCDWKRDGQLLRIDGDPFDGFNAVNAGLFPDWDRAVFASSYTYYYVGRYREYPRYLCGPDYERDPGSNPWFRVRVHVSWNLDRGRGYCRPVYQPQYVCRGRDDGRRQREVRYVQPWNQPPVVRRDDDGRERRRERFRDGGDQRRRERGDAQLRVDRVPIVRRDSQLPILEPAGDRSPSPDGREMPPAGRRDGSRRRVEENGRRDEESRRRVEENGRHEEENRRRVAENGRHDEENRRPAAQNGRRDEETRRRDRVETPRREMAPSAAESGAYTSGRERQKRRWR